jgi:hypothetical protein
MADSVPVIPRQELRDTNGQTFAYFLPADEMHRLLAEIDSLREQLAALGEEHEIVKAERAEYLRKVFSLIGHTPLPPMSDAEREAIEKNPTQFEDLIDELERK